MSRRRCGSRVRAPGVKSKPFTASPRYAGNVTPSRVSVSLDRGLAYCPASRPTLTTGRLAAYVRTTPRDSSTRSLFRTFSPVTPSTVSAQSPPGSKNASPPATAPTGPPAHLDPPQAGGVREDHGHGQQHTQFISHVLGRDAVKRLGAIAALQQKRLTARDRGEPVTQVIAFACKYQRRHRA